MDNISIDTFMELKKRKTTQVFIFLLKGESSWLDQSTSWINHIRFPVHMIRMTEEGFKTLDIGVHPKVVITKDGNEVKTLSGIPGMADLNEILSKFY